MKIGLWGIIIMLLVNGCNGLHQFKGETLLYEANACSKITNPKSLDFLEQQYRCTSEE